MYVSESFTPDEEDLLRRYFTNLDGPVFALVNLPEVVKGALFARYSRSAKSLRRLFLDEFVGELDVSGDHSLDATVGLRRAEDLYEKVFVEYGDDSVAQLGGVHLACEQASNLLTKILEWGRLASYLEQSTRYIAYDARLGGRYRYYRDLAILSSPLGTRYVGDLDRLFDTYGQLIEMVQEHVRATVPKQRGDSDFVYRQATRAKALDAVRGVLPAAVTVERRHLRLWAGLRGPAAAHAQPSAARGRHLRRAHAARAAQGHPELPPPRRCPRSRWSVERPPGAHPHRDGRGRLPAVRRRGARGHARGQPGRLGSRRRGQAAGRHLLRVVHAARASDRTPGPAALRRRADQPRPGLRGASGRTGATSLGGPSSASTTDSTCCRTTAPSATCSGTGS